MATKAAPAAPASGGGLSVITLVLCVASCSLISLGGTYAIIKYAGPQQAKAAASAAPAEHHQNPTYPLDQFIINLGNPNDRRFLKTSVTLEIETPKLDMSKLKGEALQKAMDEFIKDQRLHDPAFKDVVIEVLSRKLVPEVSTSQGKAAIKAEILQKLNALMPADERVVQLYFTDYIVQ